MKTATFLRAVESSRGEARLYRLSVPLEGAAHVIVSAVTVPYGGGPETYIFPATPEGDVRHWGELEGSYRGGLDHERALRNAGYEVAHQTES